MIFFFLYYFPLLCKNANTYTITHAVQLYVCCFYASWVVSHCRPTQTEDYTADRSTKSHWLNLPQERKADQRNEEREACLHQMLYSLKPGILFHILYTWQDVISRAFMFKGFIPKHHRSILGKGFAQIYSVSQYCETTRYIGIGKYIDFILLRAFTLVNCAYAL